LFLTERALRPVRDITQAAADIGATNLSGRLPVFDHDEFTELAITFNAMLERLEMAFRQLEESADKQRRLPGTRRTSCGTPLTIIKATTSLALSSERSAASYRTSLVAVDKAADRMNLIVQDLLLLARSDTGSTICR